MFLDNDHCSSILEDFAESNKENLLKIKVNMDLYGKFDTAGCHDDEPEPVKNTYNAWR